ncbi:MAG: T9SS type A sorting domain-containing protein [Candidatus Marinimicrobia bacterium]|nr:T9SS type A sorting domain-containing protein [Candidatus Neomarinimicrobiota bacterium]
MRKFYRNRELYAGMLIILLSANAVFAAEHWKENPLIFNPSGVPSLTFSQPRFADLDGDGDLDLILGNSSDKPFYMTNAGSTTNPKFTRIEDVFENVSFLDAEVAAFGDLDGDGDLDMVCGGFSGLQLYLNTGHAVAPVFEKVPDFFSGISVSRYPVPDLADVDNDGDLDLLAGFSEDGNVKVYYNSGTDTAAVFLESASLLLGDVGLYAYPVFCDPDNDGDFDILCGRDGYGFYYYKNNGTAAAPNWQRNDALFSGIGNDTYFNSPVIADLNGDGKPDMVYGNGSGPLIYYRNSGTVSSPAWTKDNALFGGVLDVGGASSPVFIDLNNDGDLDLLTGTQMGDIKYYENIGTPTGPAWKSTHGSYAKLKHSIYAAATFGDANGDGRLDALVGDLSGNIYYHENSASGFSSSNYLVLAELGGWAVPRFIDLDRDGDLDIVAGNEDGYLFYYENLGTPTAPLWSEISNFFGGIDFGYNSVPAFADIDFDDDYDLIVGVNRVLRYFENQDGNWVEDTSMFSGISGGQNSTPAMADLDGDGDSDLIIGNYDGTFKYYENTREVVSVKEYPFLPESCAIYAYPNPFNPQTLLNFEVPMAGSVHMALYDMSGRLVRTLMQRYCDAGSHTLRLRATADMSSGIYLVRMNVDGRTGAVSKVLFLK